LIIPGHNDSDGEIERFCNWVVEKLGSNSPVHFSCFHPDYKMTDLPRTPMDTMIKAYNIATKSGILYCYLGNVPHGDYENTVCPGCGNICIKRHGFSIDLNGSKNGRCTGCGTEISIIS